MISPLDVSVLDGNSEELGIETDRLMTNAGKALAESIMERFERAPVLIFIGSGNNGGDGLVASRFLSENGYGISVVLMKDPSRLGSPLSKKAFEDLPEEVEIRFFDDVESDNGWNELLEKSVVVIDGLLGSGAKGEPRGKYRKAVDLINSVENIVSIDIPTGCGTDLSVKASMTVTFHDIKSNMVSDDGSPLNECGEVIVKKIGIPARAARFIGKGDLLRIPGKGKNAHKGEGGKMLVIGGGPFTGAPVLAALGGLKTGCDLVRVAVPKGIWEVTASCSPCLIAERLDTEDAYRLGPEIVEDLKSSIKWADSVLIGPGSGREKSTLKALGRLADISIDMGKKTCIDADGITAVSRGSDEWPEIKNEQVLLTPHRGELSGLLDGAGIGFDEERMKDPYFMENEMEVWSVENLDPALRFTKITGTVLLVKGRIDMIMTPHPHSLDGHILHHPVRVRYNSTGVPEMSVGGTGDVLAGLCTGFMARGLRPFDSACVSSYINGRAGERAGESKGISMSACDLLEEIHHVLSSSSGGS
jgi:NAD(P)H-hydrate epimerase